MKRLNDFMDMMRGKWRYFLAGLILGAVMMFLSGTACGADRDPVPTPLPLEVVSAKDFAVFSLNFYVPDATGVTEMYLVINNPGYTMSYSAKASVRINGVGWIPIKNETVTCMGIVQKLGCISGALSNVAMTVPVTGVRTGNNTVEFRFNGTDGVTSAYTVMEANFLNAQGEKVMPPELFTYVDPYLAVIPSTDPAVIERGKWVVNNADLIDSPINPTILKARCVDCHELNMKDLSRLRHSHARIVSRSLFHGLDSTDAESVSAYVRSLNAPEIGDPTTLLYQPGPGLDDGDVYDWVRGSGIVLENDVDIAPYLLAEWDRMGDRMAYDDLNMRELPQAWQNPDWNKMLPRVAPIDASNDFENSKYMRGYRALLALDDGPTPPTGTQRVRALESWLKGADFDITVTNSKTDAHGCLATLSARQFKFVRFQGYLLDHPELMEASEIYPRIPGDNRDHGEFRAFPGIISSDFTIAPHRVCTNDWEYAYLKEINNLISAMWYRLSIQQNGGHRHCGEQNCNDWKYQVAHNNDITGKYDVPQIVYSLASFWKSFQQANKDLCDDWAFSTAFPESGGAFNAHTKVNIGQCPMGLSFDADYANGLNWRGAGPAGLLGGAEVSSAGLYVARPGYPSRELYRQLTEPMAKAWIEVISLHDPDEWERGPGELALSSSDTIWRTDMGGYFMNQQEDVTKLRRLILLWKDLGFSWYTLKMYVDYGKRIAPVNDWDSLIGPEPDPLPEPEPIEFVARDPDAGRFQLIGNSLLVEDETGEQPMFVDYGVLEDGETFTIRVDSLFRSVDEAGTYNSGAGFAIGDMLIGVSEEYVKLYVDGRAFMGDWGSTFCLRASRSGDVVSPQWSSDCSSWEFFYTTVSAQKVTRQMTDFTRSLWARSRVPGEKVGGLFTLNPTGVN